MSLKCLQIQLLFRLLLLTITKHFIVLDNFDAYQHAKNFKEQLVKSYVLTLQELLVKRIFIKSLIRFFQI